MLFTQCQTQNTAVMFPILPVFSAITGVIITEWAQKIKIIFAKKSAVKRLKRQKKEGNPGLFGSFSCISSRLFGRLPFSLPAESAARRK